MASRNLMVLACIGLGLVAPAEAQDHLSRTICPNVWLGAEQAGVPLTHAIGWYQHFAMLGPPMDGIETQSGPGDIHLDCAYGPGGWESPLRITVVVPGHPTYCGYLKSRQDAQGSSVYGCETMVTDEEARIPPTWRMSEIIDRQTTLLGFGLDQSVDMIRSTAMERAFHEEENTHEGAYSFVRGEDRIIVRFSSIKNRSREITWIVSPDVNIKKMAANEISLRFGYRLEEVSGPISWDPKSGAHGPNKTVRPNAAAHVRLERPNDFTDGYHLILDEP